VESYTEKLVTRPYSQGANYKKKRMNNTLRAALSVSDEGVVKGIGTGFLKALD
jgi:hypothetical protein